MSFFKNAIFSTCFLALVCQHALSADDAKTTVTHVIQNFCDFEFNGGQNTEQRKALVHYSDSYIKKASKAMEGLSPYVFEWQVAPLDVIKSYNIDDVVIKGDKAYADVSYKLVAKRPSWSGMIKSISPADVHVQLHAALFNGQWLIIDPEQPKISTEALEKSYRKQSALPSSWWEHASSVQLLWARNLIDNILMLDKLY